MNKNVNDLVDIALTYDLHLYSRNDALSIFLESLSYHRVGAAFLAHELARRSGGEIGSVLDVGCGDGMFTSALVREMRLAGMSGPQEIYAFDPDRKNLVVYASKLRAYEEISLTTTVASLEQTRLPQAYDLVVCSHSLYGTLENPSLNELKRLTKSDAS